VISLLDNYRQLMTSLRKTAGNSHRQMPQLMAVSKAQSIENLDVLLSEGHRLFGENRVQEALQKWPLLKEKYPDCKLHLIGQLQTNKVSQAVRLFDVIETLDRPSLAVELANVYQKLQIRRPLLIQINTGREPQKAGILPEDFEGFLQMTRALELPIVGLMCVPPANEEPISHFAYLCSVAKRYELPYLSMGMSHDYKIAIEYDTSWVRIGTALFGQR
jgi:pyridoxal phosphate enzyme (YggS family)